MEDEETGTFDPAGAQAMLGTLTQRYTGLDAKEAETRQRVEQSRAQRLQQAREQIRAMRFGEPTSAEQLFALSAAFLSPKPYRGIAGTLANVIPTLGAASSARSRAEDKRAEMLAKLEQDYAEGTETQDLDRVGAERESLIDLMKVYGPLAKPKARRTAIDQTRGVVLDLDTGEEVMPASSVPQGAIDQLLTYVQNPTVTPANRQTAIKNFERRFRVPAAQFLSGGQ